ncbi:hypothetical protein [Gordonia phthalatica]|uniref:Uncharacterized protein n=1 Tax=Gordonia phthalatica TaxID=1136941 RepID=A0A0N9MQH6_9ACTN|nr:hypothetical protein [Gordonia phthalatica]ALG85112.1 hypothetical protein ACH46_12270 [Gordonia phthalatica]
MATALTIVGAALLVGCGGAETVASSSTAVAASTTTSVMPSSTDPLLARLRTAAESQAPVDLSVVVDRKYVYEYAILDGVTPDRSAREMALRDSDGAAVYVMRVPEMLLNGCAGRSEQVVAICGRAEVRRLTERGRDLVPPTIRPRISAEAFVLTVVR